MLSRVLEPEVIADCQEAIEYSAIDHREVNAAFVADLLLAGRQRGVLPESSSEAADDGRGWIDVLDLGVGPADIAIALCRERNDARVLGVDLSEHMLDLAMSRIDRARYRDRVRLDLQDVKALTCEVGQFHIVYSNSLIHHLPDPRPCLREAWRVTAPGGMLFFRDLARPADEDEWQTLMDQHAAGGPAQRKMFGDSLRAALTPGEILQMANACGWASATVERTSDRHWTLVAVRD